MQAALKAAIEAAWSGPAPAVVIVASCLCLVIFLHLQLQDRLAASQRELHSRLDQIENLIIRESRRERKGVTEGPSRAPNKSMSQSQSGGHSHKLERLMTRLLDSSEKPASREPRRRNHESEGSSHESRRSLGSDGSTEHAATNLRRVGTASKSSCTRPPSLSLASTPRTHANSTDSLHGAADTSPVVCDMSRLTSPAEESPSQQLSVDEALRLLQLPSSSTPVLPYIKHGNCFAMGFLGGDGGL